MKRITLQYKGEEIVSNAFDMKTYRAMYEAYVISGYQSAGERGLIALFDGTVITETVIVEKWHELDSRAVEEAIIKLHGWFTGIKINGATGNSENRSPSLFSIYSFFHRNYHYLPSEIDKQDPQMLFDILADEQNDNVNQCPGTDNVPEHYRSLLKP